MVVGCTFVPYSYYHASAMREKQGVAVRLEDEAVRQRVAPIIVAVAIARGLFLREQRRAGRWGGRGSHAREAARDSAQI